MSLIKMNRSKSPRGLRRIANWIDNESIFEDPFFNQQTQFPALNVKENETDFELELAVPGFSKEGIEVSLDHDILRISGSNEETSLDDTEGYMRKDFSYANFERTMQLPQDVDVDEEVKATYDNGILKLKLHKKAAAIEKHSRTINID